MLHIPCCLLHGALIYLRCTTVQGIGYLTNPIDAKVLAGFFRSTPGLDKTLVGVYAIACHRQRAMQRASRQRRASRPSARACRLARALRALTIGWAPPTGREWVKNGSEY